MLKATTALALEMASLRSFSSAWRVALITSKAAEEGNASVVFVSDRVCGGMGKRAYHS